MDINENNNNNDNNNNKRPYGLIMEKEEIKDKSIKIWLFGFEKL